ncbi:MAG: ABC transporter substrate-binding protein [Spirochaetes bacterium]|nr:ABC transporter substrate-binding protein [Spirochaetota bacterium]
MKKSRIFFLLLVTALLLGTVTGCGAGADDGIITIVVADNGWDSQRIHNALARIVVENAFDGFRLTLSTASTPMNWESIRNGDVDLEIEAWAEHVATFPEDVSSGDMVVLGVVVPDGRQGVFVPRFVIEGDPARGIAPMAPTLVRLDDLPRYAHVFPDYENPARGRLFGAIPGWMSDERLYMIYLYHGLDAYFNYIRLGSEAALFASLISAYEMGVPWLGYSYSPSWIAGVLDLVELETDPFEPEAFLEGRTGFPIQPLMTISSRFFSDRVGPELVGFFNRFATGGELISQALAYMINTPGATHEQTAIWMLTNNDHLIDEWLEPENAQRLRAFLSQ